MKVGGGAVCINFYPDEIDWIEEVVAKGKKPRKTILTPPLTTEEWETGSAEAPLPPSPHVLPQRAVNSLIDSLEMDWKRIT